ncbi:MAG: PAS domain S-box protein [Acidobacteriota bacterium]
MTEGHEPTLDADPEPADEARRENDQLLRAMFERSAVAKSQVAVDTGCFNRVNRSFCELTGYSAEELAAKTPADITHPDDRAADAPLVQRLLRGDSDFFETDKRYVRKDGRIVWVHVNATLLRDRHGRPQRAVAGVQDITARKHAEVALRVSEQQFRGLTNAIPNLVWACSPAGANTFHAPQWETVTGQSVAEGLGFGWTEMLHPDDRAAATCEWERAVATGTSYQFEYRLRTRDGTYRWFLARGEGLRDDTGEVAQWIGTSTDIHHVKTLEMELRAAEAALLQNTALFTRLVDQAPTGMYVVDAEFRLQQVNALAAPVFGSLDPLIGRDFAEVMRTLWGPEVGGQMIQIFRHTLATGERYVSPPFVERRYDLNEEQAFDWETQRVTLGDGRYGVVCYFHEITARQRSERSLRATEERMRLATEATGVGIWEWNVPAGQVHWDAEMFRIYGVEPTLDGLVGYADWVSAVVAADAVEHERSLQAAVARGGGGSSSRHTFRILRARDGACRHIESVATVRANRSGAIEWVVGTNLDITERALMAQALQDTDRRKDEFLATLAHELRNPLAPIRTGLSVLAQEGRDGPHFERVRSMMERQVGQLVRLIDDLMDVSRITSGKFTLRRERIDLADTIANAVETSRPLVEQMSHCLTVSLPPQPVVLDADPLRVAQVVVNLLQNAAKYSDRGGRIDLTVTVEGSDVRIAVKDTGVGIAADQLPHLFAMFAQIERSISRAQGGLGIGLSLSKRLVEMHGGRIDVTSAGPGRGSEFVVRLPTVPADTAADAAPAPRLLAAAPASRRILIVDDNRDGADTLALVLQTMGHETCTAYDGRAAIERAESFRPEVVLLDIGLPILDGYATCRRLRAQSWAHGVVVIAVTGWGAADDKRRAREAGFDRHLVKPVDPQALARVLRDEVDVGGPQQR